MRVSQYFLGRPRVATILATVTFIPYIASLAVPALAQRPSTDRHVPELAQYFDGVKIAAPIVVQGLAVYPVLVDDVPLLHGRWQTLDEAIDHGTLVIREKDGGNVPTVSVENRGIDTYILLMTGDVIKGGMQTRTVRQDTVLGPRQRIDLDVFCVEAQRWEGAVTFSSGKFQAPQSIKGEIRGGGGQSEVWSRVAENNAALGTENASHSLEVAVKDSTIEKKLAVVRKRIVPEIPRGTVGFIFVHGGRAVGAEFFGSEALARAELPQFLDSYTVDYVIRAKADARRGLPEGRPADKVATSFFERICRAGSERTKTAGSGAGIRTDSGDLLGDGVSLDSTLVHFGVQVARRVVPMPKMAPANQYDAPRMRPR
jgi:hypothetical protein